MSERRRCAVAGTWYAADGEALRRDVDRLVAAADVAPAVAGSLVAAISPHAGLVYSGPVAACSYRALAAARPDTVVLIGPAHRGGFDGCSVWASGAWETPLGDLEVDAALAGRLAAARSFAADPGHHLGEHSLEMQLPFLARLAPDARIVPVLMGWQTRAACLAAADALVRACESATSRVVIVASSDLSHYNTAGVAHALDAKVVDDVARFDAEALMGRLEAEPHHACGGGPIVATMTAARRLGAERATILRYADSGDEGPRDKSSVVGYLAAAFSRPEPE